MVQFGASVNQTKIWARSLAWVFVAGILSLPAQAKLDDKDLFDRMVLDPTLKTFTKLIVKAGMVEALKADGPFTVFAPNDAAFAKVPPTTINAWMRDKALLRKMLNNQIVASKLLTKDLKDGTLKTLSGVSFQVFAKVTVPITPISFGGAKVLTPDSECSNGILNIIGSMPVPMPPPAPVPATKPVKPPK